MDGRTTKNTRAIALALALAVACVYAGIMLVRSPHAAAAMPAYANAAGQDVHKSVTFREQADNAFRTLETELSATPGRWNLCIPDTCGSTSHDWGADALTYTLFLRWKSAHDPAIASIMSALSGSLPTYGNCVLGSCQAWSDMAMWDSIAASRAYEVTRDGNALVKAERAFALVDDSNAYGLGACPGISYQRPGGGKTMLKTLETDSNFIKAALLLHEWTGDPSYLRKATARYQAVRQTFLDPHEPLYTTYVFDDGRSCAQVPGRFFASVNGNMIFNGIKLAERTGESVYLADATATARAVASELNDSAGYFVDLQAENDVVEPLVEAMQALAVERHVAFARAWLLRNAANAIPAASGAYGRFLAGPAPSATLTAWETNGGLALAIAAGTIEPDANAAPDRIWAAARYVPEQIATVPAALTFTGRAVALIGTIGDRCCEAGHARVFVDGTETRDKTGIWQNKSSSSARLPNAVLFSWRWPTTGRHTISFAPGEYNPKEGGSYLHVDGYEYVP